jgi:hypothetical protein
LPKSVSGRMGPPAVGKVQMFAERADLPDGPVVCFVCRRREIDQRTRVRCLAWTPVIHLVMRQLQHRSATHQANEDVTDCSGVHCLRQAEVRSFTRFNQFQHECVNSVVLFQPVNGGDIGVVERGERARLAFEPR